MVTFFNELSHSKSSYMPKCVPYLRILFTYLHKFLFTCIFLLFICLINSSTQLEGKNARLLPGTVIQFSHIWKIGYHICLSPNPGDFFSMTFFIQDLPTCQNVFLTCEFCSLTCINSFLPAYFSCLSA